MLGRASSLQAGAAHCARSERRSSQAPAARHITASRPRRARHHATVQAALAAPAPAADATAGGQSAGPARGKREKVGVLLLNLGGPETLDDVQPFLQNLFSDPDILRLPKYARWLQGPLGWFISVNRAPISAAGYKAIGGGSPLRRITDCQAAALAAALVARGQDARVYVGMRYWHPFTEEAVAAIKADGIERLVVLPLYPQFSISTSGSSLRLLERLFAGDDYLRAMPHTVIPSWYQRPGYVCAMADLIVAERAKFLSPESVHLFFSAHGVPVSYVQDAGDPYKEEMEECVALIAAELTKRRVANPWTLAYQSRVGPVEWLQPYTDASIRDLGARGVVSLLAVPISFVSEHIETLEEIDVEYRELAASVGITDWGRVPALGVNAVFIDDLAASVIDALPYVGSMAPTGAAQASAAGAAIGSSGSSISPRALVPTGSVGDLLAAYDSEKLELPAPVSFKWEWGWTKSAETWNGRLAMMAIAVVLALEAASGHSLLKLLAPS